MGGLSKSTELPNVPKIIVQFGDHGDKVKEIQSLVGVSADGVYGPITEKAVKDFQIKNNLMVSGAVDQETYDLLKKPAQPPGPVNPSTDKIFGVDVSHYQGNPDWQSGEYSKAQFAFGKCTEGISHSDKSFKYNRSALSSLSKPFGAYHFFRANLDAKAQMDWFFINYTPQSGELHVMLDFETLDGVSVAQFKDNAFKACEIVKERTGAWPFFYTYTSFLKDLGDVSQFLNCPLWIANYGPSKPHFTGWNDWVIWQYNADNNLDKNWFKGSLLDLKTKYCYY